jgi:DNA-directed RNA polymerase subunit L
LTDEVLLERVNVLARILVHVEEEGYSLYDPLRTYLLKNRNVVEEREHD